MPSAVNAAIIVTVNIAARMLKPSAKNEVKVLPHAVARRGPITIGTDSDAGQVW